LTASLFHLKIHESYGKDEDKLRGQAAISALNWTSRATRRRGDNFKKFQPRHGSRHSHERRTDDCAFGFAHLAERQMPQNRFTVGLNPMAKRQVARHCLWRIKKFSIPQFENSRL
jgi:hypothetical protein